MCMILTKENFIDKSSQELDQLIGDEVTKYKVEVGELDEDEILQREQDMIALMNNAEEELKSVMYALPESCTFDGQVFGKKAIMETIVDFLNTQEVEWSYTLGMMELVKLWKNHNLNEIGYYTYDSTLRILGQRKYRGYDAWRKIMAANEYLSSCHREYMRDMSYTVYLAQLHNVLIEGLKKFNQASGQEEGLAEIMPLGDE